jgi:DNA-binding response OmpR family regulator
MPTTNPTMRDRKLVMLVEDEAITGFALADLMEDAGYAVVGPFARSTAAAEWLSDHTPDVAILDVVLSDGSCAGVAQLLRSKGVPFLVHSGWSYRDDIGSDFKGAPWLEKPAHFAEIAACLATLSGRTSPSRMMAETLPAFAVPVDDQ